MKNPFLFFFRARDKPKDAVSAATTFSFGMTGSGKSVNARTAIQVSAVYACVRVIAETVASLPFSVFEQDKTGSQKALDHPLYRILHDEPNPEMTQPEVRNRLLFIPRIHGYGQILQTFLIPLPDRSLLTYMLLQIRELTTNNASDDITHAVIVAHLFMLIPRSSLTRLSTPLSRLHYKMWVNC